MALRRCPECCVDYPPHDDYKTCLDEECSRYGKITYIINGDSLSQSALDQYEFEAFFAKWDKEALDRTLEEIRSL